MIRTLVEIFGYYCGGCIASNVFMSILSIVYAPASITNGNKNPWKLAYHLSDVKYEVASLFLSAAIIAFMEDFTIAGVFMITASILCGYGIPVIMRSVIASIGVNLTMRNSLRMNYSRYYIFPEKAVFAISTQECLIGLCTILAFTWDTLSIPLYMVISVFLIFLSIWIALAKYVIFDSI